MSSRGARAQVHRRTAVRAPASQVAEFKVAARRIRVAPAVVATRLSRAAAVRRLLAWPEMLARRRARLEVLQVPLALARQLVPAGLLAA